jgi:hypothetical protein
MKKIGTVIKIQRRSNRRFSSAILCASARNTFPTSNHQNKYFQVFFIRPRISILTALLLMAILAMAIGFVEMRIEVVRMRAELRSLRDETGRLTVEDPQKMYAIGVRTNDPLLWKWRIWVPEGATVFIGTKWGDVPAAGIPSDGQLNSLDPGEQWITMHAYQDPKDNSWRASLEAKNWKVPVPLPPEDCFWTWPNSGLLIDGVLFETGSEGKSGEPFILTRDRRDHSNGSVQLQATKAPSAGFIIWLERH